MRPIIKSHRHQNGNITNAKKQQKSKEKCSIESEHFLKTDNQFIFATDTHTQHLHFF